MSKKPKIEELKISEHTKNEMVKFFMKTSVPRIIKKMQEKQEGQGKKNDDEK